MTAETPRIAPSAPRYGPQGAGGGADRPQTLASPSSTPRETFRNISTKPLDNSEQIVHSMSYDNDTDHPTRAANRNAEALRPSGSFDSRTRDLPPSNGSGPEDLRGTAPRGAETSRPSDGQELPAPQTLGDSGESNAGQLRRIPLTANPLGESRRSPFRTVWDELGYLHDHPATGETVRRCAGCIERSSDS